MIGSNTDIYSKIKNTVSGIGEWIEDRSDTVSYWLAIVVVGIAVISAVIGVITTWIHNGFGKALITAVISVIALGIFIYIVSIAASLGRFAVKILSYAFKNIYILELVILVLLSLAYFSSGKWEAASQELSLMSVKSEQPQEPQVEQYRCTARKVLNIRVAPSSDAKVIGSINSGDVVDVYGISDGFALIKYDGEDAYVSLKYLEKI